MSSSSSSKSMVKQTIGKPSERSDSAKYKGVRKRKWGKWVSEIRLPNSRERIWLGSYDSPEKAARAFDAALFCLRGRSSKFNFPNNPPEISAGRALTPSEIQAEAARFANSEPPRIQHSMSELQAEEESQSQSPSVSEGSGTIFNMHCDFQVNQNDSFTELLPFGSGNYATEYGLFPGFDDLNGQFFSPATEAPTPAVDYYAEENFDGVIPAQESFLWNF